MIGDRLASHADVLRGLRGAGKRGEPLRNSAWEARYIYDLGLSLHTEHFLAALKRKKENKSD